MSRTRSRLPAAAGLLAVFGLTATLLAPGQETSRLAVAVVGGFGLLVSVGLLRFQQDPEDRAFLATIVFTAIAARLVVFALVRQTVGPYVFAPDALSYEIYGGQLLESWQGLRPPPLRATEGFQVGYIYLNAALFWLFGRAPAAPALVNAFLGSWTAIPVYHLARTVCRGHRGVGRWAAALTAFFPSLILWSVLNIREAPTILLIATAIFFAVRFQHEGRPWDLLGFAIPLLVLALFREYLMVLVGFAAGAGVLMGKSRTPVRAMLGGVLLLVLTTFVLQGAGVGASLASEPSLDRLEFLRQDLARGAGSAYGTEADVSTVSGAVTFLPVGLAYFLFAPFPWSVTSVLQTITLPESLLWYALVLVGLRGLWLALRHDARAYTVVLSVLITVTFSYALVEGNVGTAYRHRAQILPLSFVLIAVGLQDLWAGRAERRASRRRQRARVRGDVGSVPRVPEPHGPRR